MRQIPIPNHDEAIVSLFDRLDKGTPSQLLIIQQLRACHEMDIASKVIQATEVSNLKRKAANKKPRSTKTINSNHWDSDVRRAALEKKAFDEEIEREKALAKAQKEQEKLDKRTAEEIRKALNKSAREIKAAETRRKKEVMAQEKIERTRKREEAKAKKIADKAAKRVHRVSKVTNQRRNRKASSSVTSDLQEDLSVIEEENTQLENTQAFQSDDIEDITQLPPVDQLGYDNDNDIAAQLAVDLQATLTLDTDNQPSSNRPTRTQESRRRPKRYDDN